MLDRMNSKPKEMLTLSLLVCFVFGSVANSFESPEEQARVVSDLNGGSSHLKAYLSWLSNSVHSSFLNGTESSRANLGEREPPSRRCTLSECFDFSRCRAESFSVFVYKEPHVVKSGIFKKILVSLEKSLYYTDDASRACLFVASIDTLDRDRLSDNYVKNLSNLTTESPFAGLAHWNVSGANHLIFNLYSGTWPYYIDDDLDLNRTLIQRAILVKTSFSVKTYRKNFDISFPLFHADLPATSPSNETAFENTNLFNAKKYLLTFKGKRYLNGVGTETRNAIYHLNNARDVLMLTTCKHGSNWQEMKDERCDVDMEAYDKYDYAELLSESTFCLIPRGRRLATYRFLEALKVGCIPVMVGNSYVIPFAEVIDWSKVVIWSDERLLTQIPSILREIPKHRVFRMRQYALFYYRKYFSSVDRIVQTTLEIIKERIFKHKARSIHDWSRIDRSN